ncbi:MAG TPA: DUF5723 family protein [Sediminibacterium sp.]|nr:DUF5723 family protein [Sediminibacterium sp.]
MRNLFRVLLILSVSGLHGQGYQALHGSPFAGSTAVFNNPAASLHSAYRWDFTLFSLQAKVSSNSPYLNHFSIRHQDSAYLTMKNDLASKFLHGNMDVSLFTLSYRPDKKQAFSIGGRLRGYVHAKTAPFVYNDSIHSLHDFLVYNEHTPYLDGFMTHAGWIELDLNYSRLLWENSHASLSGGITLQIMKGISGFYTRLNKISYLETKSANDTSFYLTGGSGEAAYGTTYAQNSWKDFLNQAHTGLGFSLGVEYLSYLDDRSDGLSHNNLNYDWKIGASIMDIGANRFTPNGNSSRFSDPDPTIPDNVLDQKLNNPQNAQDLKDSLNSIFASTSTITDPFKIGLPTRLVLNIDKNLGNHFYVNGEMSLNFYSTSSYRRLNTRELNLLTITPRWETIAWGAYLPVQYNTQGQLWIGAAVKLGPLVVGLHNIGIFARNPSINGGGYLLLSIHPFNKEKVISHLDCTAP